MPPMLVDTKTTMLQWLQLVVAGMEPFDLDAGTFVPGVVAETVDVVPGRGQVLGLEACDADVVVVGIDNGFGESSAG